MMWSERLSVGTIFVCRGAGAGSRAAIDSHLHSLTFTLASPGLRKRQALGTRVVLPD